jgi:hypothetical protein
MRYKRQSRNYLGERASSVYSGEAILSDVSRQTAHHTLDTSPRGLAANLFRISLIRA